MAYTQEGRTIQVETPLGKDALLLNEVTIEERVSAPFRMHLELLSELASVDFAQLVGKPMSVMMVSLHGERYFHGVVRRFRQKAPGAGLYAYEAELVPWFWLLTQTRNCRVFTALSVPAIVEQIFGDHGMQDYELRLEQEYAERTYCVQYRESDFAFVSRLLEEEGIHYAFEHTQEKHVLVLADSSGSAGPIAGKSPQVKFKAAPGGNQPDEVVVTFDKEVSVVPAKVVLDDYDYENPTFDLQKASGDEGFEVYDWPGRYTQGDEGEHYAGVRLEELKARGTVFNGHSNRRHMAAGSQFDLVEHPNDAFNASYFVIASYHAASVAGSYGSSDGAQVQESYSNAFEAIPKDTPFRPERVTPRPVVQGSQTALVVGPSGEEIHTDSMGRVCVQFPWDRVAAADGENVCWVRVAHGAAGKNWGQLFIPRVGQEVVVDFLEGDPDRPLVTGTVYHAEAMPPLDLPDEKTRSGIKTRSTPEGDATAFNQLRFEDKKDEEQVYLQAQRNLDVRVKVDSKTSVGNDQHEVVGNDDFSHVVNDRHVIIDNKLSETVGADRHTAITGADALEAGGDVSITVGGDHVLEAGGKCGWTSGDKITLTAGEIVLEADSKVTIKVGGSELVVSSSGVTLTGSEVVVDASTAKINSGSGASGGSGDAGSATLPDQAEEALDADESNEAGTLAAEAAQGERGAGEAASVGGAAWQVETQESEEPEPTSFVSFVLKDEDDNPLPKEPFRITCADGSVIEGRTDEAGRVHVDGVAEGSCDVSFPRLDGDEVSAN